MGQLKAWVDGQELNAAASRWKGGAELPLAGPTFHAGSQDPPPDPTNTAFTVADLLGDSPFYVAHRCGGGNWPEFSMRGIEASVALGYKAIEISVRRASTGEWVCSHDWDTIRMTGESYGIGLTPWSTLSGLTSTAEFTDEPSQSRTPLILLNDVLAQYGESHVIFIDHKSTSDRDGTPEHQADLLDLMDLMDTTPGGTDRLVWKTFYAGDRSNGIAASRGYPVWSIRYSPDPLDKFDNVTILGMNWNADQTAWDDIRSAAPGIPVMAHVIYQVPEWNQAQSRSADGHMTTIPRVMGP